MLKMLNMGACSLCSGMADEKCSKAHQSSELVITSSE
jgi:hypothetical protein